MITFFQTNVLVLMLLYDDYIYIVFSVTVYKNSKRMEQTCSEREETVLFFIQ